MIAIVDYGLGNLASVQNALVGVGAQAERTADPDVIRHAAGVVLPGVGAASAGMDRLRERGLDGVIREVAHSGRPLLGLCLGMQLLFQHSEEGETACLGVLSGTVELMRVALKVPHIGWNQVRTSNDPTLWRDLPVDPYFYFVHSYVCVPTDPTLIAGGTEYETTFCSAVVSGAIWGVQFHPERSGRNGLQLIRNFVRSCDNAAVEAEM